MRINRLLLSAGVAIMALSGIAMQAQDVTLERVWPSYRDAASFTRLLEYFGGAPDAANRNALRSQPDKRAGYYWLVRTDAAEDVPGCTFKIEIHRSDQTDAQVYTFPHSVTAGSYTVNVGITGTDWIDPTERPVAWRLTLLSPDGSPLIAQHSFLWQRQSK